MCGSNVTRDLTVVDAYANRNDARLAFLVEFFDGRMLDVFQTSLHNAIQNAQHYEVVPMPTLSGHAVTADAE